MAAWVLGASATFSAHGSTYLKQGISADDIRSHYHSRHLKVLLAPGHEPAYGGTEYGTIKEREIVVMIADELEKLLDDERGIDIYRTRDNQGWNPIFAEYFDEEWDDINEWINHNRQKTVRLVEKGKLADVENVQHNNAAPDVATRLYGISKWANENNVDIVLNLHINDTPRKDLSSIGPYIGFTIYVPEKQYSNAEASREVATSIKESVEKIMDVSNMPQESEGVVEDQELIALGRYNTSDAASVLIEYGYIYESQFATEEGQKAFARRVAKQTYLGLLDFLRKK